jgi:hypothetical protein
MLLLLSTPFSFAHTLAAALAVLFSPNSITLYKLPSNFRIVPRLMSEVFAIVEIFRGGKGKGKKTFFVLRFSLFVVLTLPRHKNHFTNKSIPI